MAEKQTLDNSQNFTTSPQSSASLEAAMRDWAARNAEGVESTATPSGDHDSAESGATQEEARFKTNEELSTEDMAGMSPEDRIERWTDYLRSYASEISRVAGEEFINYAEDHGKSIAGFSHDEAIKHAMVASGAFESEADLEEALSSGSASFGELKRAYTEACADQRIDTDGELEGQHESTGESKQDNSQSQQVEPPEQPHQPAETANQAQGDSEDPKLEESGNEQSWMHPSISRAEMHLRGDGKYEYKGDLYAEDGYYIRALIEEEREVSSVSQGDQQPQTTSEQEKKDKLEQLTAKVDVNITMILNLVLGSKDQSVQSDDVARARIIRDALKTLGTLSQAEIDDLNDADILAIFNGANHAHGSAATPAFAFPASASQAGARQPIIVPPLPGASTATPRQPIVVPPLPVTVTTTGTGARQPIVVPPLPGTSATPRQPIVVPPLPGSPNNPPRSPDQTRHLDSMLTNVEASMLDRFDSVRDKWAKLSSKRQRRSVFGRFIARSRKYKEAKAEYDELSREVGRIGLKEKIDQAQTSAEKAAIATTYWIAEQNAVREKASGYTEDRRWWKAVNRVSAFMNKGNKITRIAKRATLGIVAGIAAAPIGATGLAAGLTFFATEQAKDLTGGIDKLTPEQEAELRNKSVPRVITDEEILEDRAKMFAMMYESDSKRQANKRLMKFGKNALKGAVAGAAAYGIHEGISAGHDYLFGSDSASAAPAPDTGTDVGGGGGSDAAGADLHAGPDTPGYGLGDAGPQETLASVPSGHDLLNTANSFYVRPGEGWYETFQDMGIPKESWADVLKDAGPKLHDLGIADFNDASGQWWIAQSGNLSTDALQTIADSSAKFGYAFKPIA